jgi:hypothetical protein
VTALRFKIGVDSDAAAILLCNADANSARRKHVSIQAQSSRKASEVYVCQHTCLLQGQQNLCCLPGRRTSRVGSCACFQDLNKSTIYDWMSEQSLLQALQRELAIEKAARQELEVGHSKCSHKPG